MPHPYKHTQSHIQTNTNWLIHSLSLSLSLPVYVYVVHHQSVLPKGWSFSAISGNKTAVLSKGRSSTANSGTKFAVLLRMNRCGNFLLQSAAHSLFSIQRDLKSGNIPGTPTWRWEEWIWLTEPSGLHRNSPQGLNISSIRVFDQIRDLKIPVILRTWVENIIDIKKWIYPTVEQSMNVLWGKIHS